MNRKKEKVCRVALRVSLRLETMKVVILSTLICDSSLSALHWSEIGMN